MMLKNPIINYYCRMKTWSDYKLSSTMLNSQDSANTKKESKYQKDFLIYKRLKSVLSNGMKLEIPEKKGESKFPNNTIHQNTSTKASKSEKTLNICKSVSSKWKKNNSIKRMTTEINPSFSLEERRKFIKTLNSTVQKSMIPIPNKKRASEPAEGNEDKRKEILRNIISRFKLDIDANYNETMTNFKKKFRNQNKCRYVQMDFQKERNVNFAKTKSYSLLKDNFTSESQDSKITLNVPKNPAKKGRYRRNSGRPSFIQSKRTEFNDLLEEMECDLLEKKEILSSFKSAKDFLHSHNGSSDHAHVQFLKEVKHSGDPVSNKKLLKELMRKKGLLNAKTKLGENALHLAVRSGNELLSKNLLQMGVDPHSPDYIGRIPLAHCKENNLSKFQSMFNL